MTNYFGEVYQGKKVLITGDTGFKGSWLSLWLTKLKAQVYGFSHDKPSTPNHFDEAKIDQRITHIVGDVRNLSQMQKTISDIRPDFVFHLAAQALARPSYEKPIETLETNFMGTANVLEALRISGHPCTAIMITSDKAYDNVEWEWGYRENDHLGGKDPYSASKGAAELVIKTYAYSYFLKEDSSVRVASTRAGNVIGGGDWATDRIVADAVRAWSVDKALQVRNPHATRPWQHVLEPLSGYLRLGQRLFENPRLNGHPFNFGPSSDQNFSVKQLLDEMKETWKETHYDDLSSAQSEDQKYEAKLLRLNSDKAHHYLEWKPTLEFKEAVSMTMDWYLNFYKGNTAIDEFTLDQIEKYQQLAFERNLDWAKS